MGQLTGSITKNGVGFVKATIDGISFNKITTSATKDAKLRSREDSINYVWKNGVTSLDQWTGVINAVDIDWNEAELPYGDLNNATSKTISTTSELLSLINTMQQEIYVLAAAVVALSENS